jgi:hypothetical protein
MRYELTDFEWMPSGLFAPGIPTARGSGRWSAVKIARVLEL